MSGSRETELRCGDCRWGVRFQNGQRHPFTWGNDPEQVTTRIVYPSEPPRSRFIEPLSIQQPSPAWMACPNCHSTNILRRTMPGGTVKKPPVELYECGTCGHTSRHQP